ncbi:MAG: PilZ domain-containing protein, partial [Oleiharenicola lentus]
MALFKHILDFKKNAMAKLRDKRKTKRFYVGPAFPLKATIVLPDTDTTGRKSKGGDKPDAGRNWGGSLFNMSNVGLSLQLPPAAVAIRGEKTTVTLSLDGHELKLPCTIVHFRVQNATAYCGLTLDDSTLTQSKAYLQLLEAVALGSTLAPVEGGLTHDRPGLRSERYKAVRPAILTAWRDEEKGELAGFELVLGDHCLHGEAKHPALEIFSSKVTGKNTAWSAPGFGVSDGVENEELRKLFRWIALNLSRTVPT